MLTDFIAASLMDDGRIPADNPLPIRRARSVRFGVTATVIPKGLMWHPTTGKLWETEPGRNYGWPTISNGTDRMAKIEGTSRDGMASPIKIWTPAIAPSGIGFYSGKRFPQWKDSLFVTALVKDALLRLELDGENVIHEEVIFRGMGRVRDVTTGPDGLLYVSLEGPGRIMRQVPVDGAAPAKR